MRAGARSIAAVADPARDQTQDVALVEAARSGDRAAFGQLHEKWGPVVHGILLSRMSKEDADDLVQDVFLTAMQKLETLREPAAFGAWVCMIARTKAIDHHRRAPKRADPEPEPAAEDPDRLEAERALAAIRSLPDAYRETLTLRLVEGLTGPEIAERTGLTPESVRVNLHRGMKMLREKLE